MDALLSPSPLPLQSPEPSTLLSMPLPPQATYSSKEELYASIQAWAAQHRYAFRIERSTKIHNTERTRIVYSCDRAGLAPPINHPQKSLQDRQRRTATRKTGCQFSIIVREGIDTQWELRHRPSKLGVDYSLHNHPPSQSISSHPVHRKLAQAEINQAKSLHDAGIKPGQAITYLRKMTTTPLQLYDIYNLNASFKREQRHGLSTNDTLLQHLKDRGVHFKINITATNRTSHLFISYPQSLQLAQTNQDVILIDNTYKTNKFDMPLLHMIGITSSGMTFSIGFCFLPGESKEDFVWAFQCFQSLGIKPTVIVMDGDQAQKNASEEVFPYAPTLLCIWHVNQCVLAKCKSILGNEDWPAFEAAWRTVIQARTIEQFDKQWLEFQTQYSTPKTQQCVSYLQNEWLKPGQRERLVEAWTNQYLHFGIRVTSRAEGAHAYIKRYLGGKKTKGDLYSSWLLIEAAVINQIIAVSSRTSLQQDRAPLDIDKKLYQGCFGVITWHALRLVQRHLELVSLPLQPCTGIFTQSMGLPCAHLCDIRRATGGLVPSDFHEHWYWDRKSTLQPLLDPLWAGKQRMANLQVSHTGRILSTGEEPTKQLPTCSACHKQGHTRSSRNCPLKLQASIAIQSQMLLEMEIVARQPLALTAPTASTVPVASPVITAPTVSTAPVVSTVPKQLSPDRPEVLMQAYLAEKTAWLAQHPTIRPTEYRKARKWKNPRPKVLKEQSFYMPKERRDSNGSIIAIKANWTNEEIIVWLDNEERKEEEEYNKLQAEFDANSKEYTENGRREIWTRIEEEHARDAERYIL